MKKTGGKKTNGGTPKMSDQEKMKALGLNDAEIQALDFNGITFAKLLKFITGLIKLVGEVFDGEPTTDDGGIFGAQKSPVPKEEVERLKGLGIPRSAALFGGGRLLDLIRFILSLLGIGGAGSPVGPGGVGRHIER